MYIHVAMPTLPNNFALHTHTPWMWDMPKLSLTLAPTMPCISLVLLLIYVQYVAHIVGISEVCFSVSTEPTRY